MATKVYRIEVPISVKDNTKYELGVVQRKLDNLSRTKSTVTVDAKANGFDEVERKFSSLDRKRANPRIDLDDRASSRISDIGSKLSALGGRTFRATMSVLDLATAPIRGVIGMLTSLPGMIASSALTYAGIINPLQKGMQFEQQRMGLINRLGGEGPADAFIGQMTDFANKTPFEFDELLGSSSRMMSFGFKQEDILPMMTTVGDTASAMGAGSEGISRIVRAFGQMQAKGRVQGEEMLQLMEMGIPVNQILQEELGLTREQIGNIGKEQLDSTVAIDAMLAGLKKRYGGMMDDQSKTAQGMMSTIKDFFNNNIIRKWGEGLWSGIKPFMSKITALLDNSPEKLKAFAEQAYQLGKQVSDAVAEVINVVAEKVGAIISTDAFKDAGLLAKAGMLWDEIIKKPFDSWWESAGRPWIIDKVNSIGRSIGDGLENIIVTIFGGGEGGSTALADGASIGASFANGFISGFDAGRVGKAILAGLMGIFTDSKFAGGSSSTSWLSTLLVGSLGLKVAGGGLKTYGALAPLLSGLGGLAKPGAASFGPKAAQLAGMGTGVGSLAGGMSIGGALLGLLGIADATEDFIYAGKITADTAEKERKNRNGATKVGLVAAGAAIGSIIPGIGTLIGAGIGAGVGGLAALFGGDALSGKIGEWLNTSDYQATEIMAAGGVLKEAVTVYGEQLEALRVSEDLIGRYKELSGLLESGLLPKDEALQAQKEIDLIAEQLQNLYPDIISQQDVLNGKVGERLALLEKINALDRKNAEYELKKVIDETAPAQQKAVELLPGKTAELQSNMDRANGIRVLKPEVEFLQGDMQKEIDAAMRELEKGVVISDYGDAHELALRKSEKTLEINAEYMDKARELAKEAGYTGDMSQAYVSDLMASLKAEAASADANVKSLREEVEEYTAAVEAFYLANVALEDINLSEKLGVNTTVQEASDSVALMKGAMNDLNILMETGRGETALRDIFNPEILKTFQELMPELDLKGTDKVQDKIGAIARRFDEIEAAVRESRRAVDLLNATIQGLKDKNVNIRINTVNTTPIPSLGSLARDYGTKISQSAYAEGDDYISRPHFGLIAEDGPEAIIPLGAKRRQRGIDLWLKAGKHLGVPGYAEGIIAGSTSQSAVGGINVTANPTVQVTVTNGDPDATEAAVVRGLKRSADIIAGEIAAKLGGSFANAMP